MNRAEVFMTPGKWTLNMVMSIFDIPPYYTNSVVYTAIAFVISFAIWLRSLRFLAELAKSSFNR